jgi:hypothetical protein
MSCAESLLDAERTNVWKASRRSGLNAVASERLVNGGGDCVLRAQSERAGKEQGERKRGQFHASGSLSFCRAVVNGWNFDRRECGLANAAGPGRRRIHSRLSICCGRPPSWRRPSKDPSDSSNERVHTAKTLPGRAGLIAAQTQQSHAMKFPVIYFRSRTWKSTRFL